MFKKCRWWERLEEKWGRDSGFIHGRTYPLQEKNQKACVNIRNWMKAFYLSTALTNTKKYRHKTTTYKNGYLYTRYYTTILLSAWFNNFWNIKQYFQPTYLTGINCNKHVFNFVSHKVNLTLLVPIPDEEKKIKFNFYFHTSLRCLERF